MTSGPDRNDSGLLLRERILGAGLACTSGLAVLAYVFAGLPMAFTVPFVVIPTGAILGFWVLFLRRRGPAMHEFSRLVGAGAAWGLAATVGYDVVRPVLKAIIGFQFNPYRAIPIFGELMTGHPAAHPIALAAGWTYHVWNGISFGIMFALLRPRGGIPWGWAWSMALQAMMMAAYPRFLAVRLADPGFLVAGLVGHSLWGVILGWGIRREAARA